MSICGRCRGRGFIRESAGLNMPPCPDCDGKGVRQPTLSLGRSTVTVPLPRGARCKVCGELAVHHHHVVAQSRLNRYLDAATAREAKGDVRNVVPLCFRCHDRVEQGTLPLELSDLHPAFPKFIEQFDVWAALPYHLMKELA